MEEQRRRAAACAANPSLEYIPVPGEIEFTFWSIYGDKGVEILKRLDEEEARSACFGRAYLYSPAPTLAERKAGRRLQHC